MYADGYMSSMNRPKITPIWPVSSTICMEPEPPMKKPTHFTVVNKEDDFVVEDERDGHKKEVAEIQDFFEMVWIGE